MTPDDLIAFETAIAAEFNAGKIPYPVHLSDGNEAQLIKIFRDVRPQDWVFTTWRSHYHALLKGVSCETLRAAIFRGESMRLRFPEHRVYGSSIVGGTISHALGVALAIKRSGVDERVWVFVGDMAAESGAFFECHKYGNFHDLPIRWVVEDNGLSVCTDTRKVWGGGPTVPPDVKRYEYYSKWPHCGAGVRVQF